MASPTKGKAGVAGKNKKKYPPRNCLICGQKFWPRQYNQILCGEFDCRAEYVRWMANGYSRQDLEKMLQKERQSSAKK